MEPSGLAVGVIGLAGLFNNVVDCFKYIQLGRNFGRDFQTSLLKLDIARLRLSRWGQSIGLNDDVQSVRSLHETLGSEEDMMKAEEVLGHILELFSRAEQASTELRSKTAPESAELQACDPQKDMSPAMATLHNKMRDLSLKRQNQTGLRQKSKWALYKEEDFRKLIGEITDLTKDLTELFPAARTARKRICDAELSELTKAASDESLAIIRSLAASQDADLEAATLRTDKSRENMGHFISNTWSNADDTKVEQQVGQQNVYGGLSFR